MRILNYIASTSALKAGNGCLSCDYRENEFANLSRRPGAPNLVEAVIQKIEEAASELLVQANGSIKRGCVGRIEA